MFRIATVCGVVSSFLYCISCESSRVRVWTSVHSAKSPAEKHFKRDYAFKVDFEFWISLKPRIGFVQEDYLGAEKSRYSRCFKIELLLYYMCCVIISSFCISDSIYQKRDLSRVFASPLSRCPRREEQQCDNSMPKVNNLS